MKTLSRGQNFADKILNKFYQQKSILTEMSQKVVPKGPIINV